MIKKFLIIFSVLVCFLLSAGKALAQTFTFTPPTATKSAGLEFAVAVGIDVGTEKTLGADLKITYDSTLLEVVEVAGGDFFSKGGFNSSTGQVYISYGVDTAAVAKTGSGDYAVLTLKGKKAGSAVLKVVCSTQTNDSNIWDEASNDIIDCSGIENPVYTISTSSAVTTITPTSSVSTPTPPVSGIALPTFFSLGMGVLLMILGLFIWNSR